MRFLTAPTLTLALMTTPALAHPGHGPHLHQTHGVWLAVAAFGLATALTLTVALRKPVRAKA